MSEAYCNAHPSYLTASKTISLLSYNVSEAYCNANPFFLTASKTIPRSFFNLVEANFNANPSYLTASKTMFRSSLIISEAFGKYFLKSYCIFIKLLFKSIYIFKSEI